MIPVLLALFILLSFTTTYVHASESGISVSPSILKLDLSTDKEEAIFTYNNSSSSTVELNFSAQDFNQLEDSWKVNFLEPKDSQNYQYALSSWISFDRKSLRLNPNESGEIKVIIDKSRLIRGGHYASILAESKQPEEKDKLNITGVLASLLFVRSDNIAAEIEEASITEFRPLRDNLKNPTKFLLRLKNTGNIEITPYGEVEVYDSLGRLVMRGILNEDSLITLPESIRRYDIPVKISVGLLPPGIYQAKLKLHYGRQGKSLESQISFFSLGNMMVDKLLLGVIAIIASGLILNKLKRR
jgi:hypothetical protein